MKRKHNKKLKIISIILITFSLFFLLTGFVVIHPSLTMPEDTAYVNINDIVNKMKNKESITEDEYHLLSLQTGLSPQSIDLLVDQVESDYLLLFQQDHIYNNKFDKDKLFLGTAQELLLTPHLPFVDIRNGDILITSTTYTLGYRHGHSGLIVNALKGLTVEAFQVGKKSGYNYISSWLNYPNVMLLRIKEEYQKIIPLVCEYAEDYLVGLPYSIFAGTNCNLSNIEAPKNTQCSHLVWCAFKAFGIDLNSDGGWLVTPNDIANSPFLDVVEVKGFNYDILWKS